MNSREASPSLTKEESTENFNLALTQEQMQSIRKITGIEITTIKITEDLKCERAFEKRPGLIIKPCVWSTGQFEGHSRWKENSTIGRTLQNNFPHTLVDKAMNFLMEEVLTFYLDLTNLPIEVARLHERELKRWLVLFALNPDSEYVMLSSIDELWHSFIIFTSSYTAFCDQIIGRFIHHKPQVDYQFNRDQILPRYRQFYTDYENVFGERPPEDVWPTPQNLVDYISKRNVVYNYAKREYSK